MATTWGKPSLSMVARAAFLRSRKNAACSSGVSWICWRRLPGIRAVSSLRSPDPTTSGPGRGRQRPGELPRAVDEALREGREGPGLQRDDTDRSGRLRELDGQRPGRRLLGGHPQHGGGNDGQKPPGRQQRPSRGRGGGDDGGGG